MPLGDPYGEYVTYFSIQHNRPAPLPGHPQQSILERITALEQQVRELQDAQKRATTTDA